MLFCCLFFRSFPWSQWLHFTSFCFLCYALYAFVSFEMSLWSFSLGLMMCFRSTITSNQNNICTFSPYTLYVDVAIGHGELVLKAAQKRCLCHFSAWAIMVPTNQSGSIGCWLSPHWCDLMTLELFSISAQKCCLCHVLLSSQWGAVMLLSVYQCGELW